VFLVEPFTSKFREQLKQARKLYTLDNGLTAALSTKVTEDRGAMLENLVFQELRRRGVDLFTWSESTGEVDFLIREGRRVACLIQVCDSLDRPETISREYTSLHKAAATTRCRDLLILTRDGRAPPERLVPKGPRVRVQAVWEWLLAPSAPG
jgi:predicted AAA+ superfamily ATPase